MGDLTTGDLLLRLEAMTARLDEQVLEHKSQIITWVNQRLAAPAALVAAVASALVAAGNAPPTPHPRQPHLACGRDPILET